MFQNFNRNVVRYYYDNKTFYFEIAQPSNSWVRSFMENKLPLEHLNWEISNVICIELFIKVKKNVNFWKEDTFEYELNNLPNLYCAIRDFLHWASLTTDELDFERDFFIRIDEFTKIYQNDDMLMSLLYEKMDIEPFRLNMQSLFNFFHRNSKWHKKMLELYNLKPFIDEQNKKKREIDRSLNELYLLEKKLYKKEVELNNRETSLNELAKTLERENKELTVLKNNIQEKIIQAAQSIVDSVLPDAMNQVQESSAKILLSNILEKADNEKLSNSELFDLEEAERKRQKKIDAFERQQHELNLEKQILNIKSEIQSYTTAHSIEHANEKADNRIAFERLDAKIEKVKIETDIRFVKVESESEKRYIQLESGMQVLKSYVDNFGITINARIDREISTVGQSIADLKINIKESFMSVEKEFGVRDVRFKEEILKLNENQMKIVGYLETLKNQTENFKQQVQNEMSRALIEIDRKGLTFEQVRATASHLLEKTEVLYKGIQVENGGLKNKLEASLGELELGKQSMFVELSKQKLVLEKATQDVYHTAKEVAYGKMDIELLHSEKQQRLNESQMQLNGTLQEIRTKEQLMKSSWANESVRTRLENQISYLNERSMIEKSNLERRAEEAEFVVRKLRDKNLAY